MLAGRRFDLTAGAVIEYCGHIREGTAPYRGWRQRSPAVLEIHDAGNLSKPDRRQSENERYP
jgi:hypothetical protein